MRWLGIWGVLKEESCLSHTVLWEVNNVGCPTVRSPMPMAIPEGIPTCWVSHLARSPASRGSPEWYLPSLSRIAPFNTNTMWARYILLSFWITTLNSGIPLFNRCKTNILYLIQCTYILSCGTSHISHAHELCVTSGYWVGGADPDWLCMTD